MSQPQMHVTCSDLHAGCPADLSGDSAEDIVLAYVLHHFDCHLVGQVALDELLASIVAADACPHHDVARRSLSGAR